MSEILSAFPKQFTERRKPLLMAHRGNRVLFPENTLAAFRQAFLDGADILETDLHLDLDGEFICIHDAKVDRTTNGTGEVKDMTLDELKSLGALDTLSQPTEHQIPTLEETAEILPESVVLALELKTDRFLEPGTCHQLGSLLNNMNVLDRTIALSFSLPRLQVLRKVIPEIPIGWISMSHLLPDKPVDLIGAFWPVLYLNSWYVMTAHRKGMIVCPLDPTPEPRLRYYLSKEVDAVLSDDPGKTHRALDQLMGV